MPAGETLNGSAPHLTMRDQETTTGGVNHAIWNVNGDGPGRTSHVDRRDRNANRLIRLQTRSTMRCDCTTTGLVLRQGIKHSLVCR